jgi:hypothetical protein
MYLNNADVTKDLYKYLFDLTVKFEKEYYYLPLEQIGNLEKFE